MFYLQKKNSVNSKLLLTLPFILIFLLLVGTNEITVASNLTKSSTEAFEYAHKHLDIGTYYQDGFQHYFADLHYYVKEAENTDQFEPDPVTLFHQMANHYAGEGNTAQEAREELAEMLDQFLPKLADFEYGNADGEVRLSDYEKMKTDLRLNPVFDTAQRLTKEHVYYDQIVMDDRNEVRRYLSPLELEGVYQMVRDSYGEEISSRRRADFPYYNLEEQRRKQAVEQMLDTLFEEFIDIFD